jgi:Pentapeptide repeats (8 copies)
MHSVSVTFVAVTFVPKKHARLFVSIKAASSVPVKMSSEASKREVSVSQRRRSRSIDPGTVAITLAAVSAGMVVAATSSVLGQLLVPPVEATTSAIMRLPPINRSDPKRCTPTSSAIGQANAARDSLLDLRECDLRAQNLAGYDLSGAILEKAVFDGSNFKDAQLSKSYATNASFRGSDFTNAVVDRANFDGADLTGAVFANAVLSDSTFDGALLTDTDWSDSYVGDFGQRAMCRNPTLTGTNPNGTPTRESLGCK